MTKLIFLSGSTRNGSVNTKLAKYAANHAKHLGADADFIDLNDFPMPIYNGDLEEKEGIPENVLKLRKQFIECDGFFIASPEYNGSFSALLKNTIDWMSRPAEEEEKPLIAFGGKVAAISAASPGGLGGLRGLVPLRMLLGNIGVTVVPSQTAIGGAMKVFDDNGDITDERQASMVQNTVKQLVDTATSLKQDK